MLQVGRPKKTGGNLAVIVAGTWPRRGHVHLGWSEHTPARARAATRTLRRATASRTSSSRSSAGARACQLRAHRQRLHDPMVYRFFVKEQKVKETKQKRRSSRRPRTRNRAVVELAQRQERSGHARDRPLVQRLRLRLETRAEVARHRRRLRLRRRRRGVLPTLAKAAAGANEVSPFEAFRDKGRMRGLCRGDPRSRCAPSRARAPRRRDARGLARDTNDGPGLTVMPAFGIMPRGSEGPPGVSRRASPGGLACRPMAREYSPKQVELAVNTIKTLSIDGVEKANSGHPPGRRWVSPTSRSSSSRATFATIRRGIHSGIGRDRFVLPAVTRRCSSTRCCIFRGVRPLPSMTLKNFRQWGRRRRVTLSTLHRRRRDHDRSARAGRRQRGRFLRWRTLNRRASESCYEAARVHDLPDGDQMEGVAAEASSPRVTRLNNPSSSGTTTGSRSRGDRSAFNEDVGKRYEAYGLVRAAHRRPRPRRDPQGPRRGDRPEGQAVLHRGAYAHRERRPERPRHGGGGTARRSARKRSRHEEADGWDPDKTFFVPTRSTPLPGERAEDNQKEKAQRQAEVDAWKKASRPRRAAGEVRGAQRAGRTSTSSPHRLLPEKEDATRNPRTPSSRSSPRRSFAHRWFC